MTSSNSPNLRAVRIARSVLLAAFAILGFGCFERNLSPVNPCNRAVFDTRISVENVDDVDLLLMVDNSNSMSGEQALLGMELPRMIQVLASGDLDGDGMQDFQPVASLHVGIVTSDMGAGPMPLPGADGVVPSCDPGLGDDGILRTAGRTAGGCAAAYPPVFDFMRGEDATAFAADVACVALMGTGGCGFEQQLEAVLKAVAPSNGAAPYVPTTGYINGPTGDPFTDYVNMRPPAFAGGYFGHGDTDNRDFIRRNSALALMLVTDEEDCSVPDYSIFYRDPRFTSVGLNLRCFTYPTWLYPTARYVQNFIHLRENPALLVYAGIVGVPTDLVGDSVAAYDAMLLDPRLTETPDPAASPPTRLLSSCSTADGGEAFPPRRMIEVARGLAELNAGTTIQSICAASFVPAVNRIIELIADALGGACLPRPLNPSADGTVACDVLELLASPESGAEITSCAGVAGAESVGFETDDATGVTRELCRITQLTGAQAAMELAAGGAGTAPPGWFYDNSDPVVEACGGNFPPGQRISFSAMHRPPTGSEVRLSCNQNVLGGGDEGAQIGTFCDPAASGPPGNACIGSPDPSGAGTLTCDDITRACQVACTTDADCREAGLLGFVCDPRARNVVTSDPTTERGDDPYLFCVNATCN